MKLKPTFDGAMSRAVVVIACGRGAIPEILNAHCGKVIDPMRTVCAMNHIGGRWRTLLGDLARIDA
jgi:hypothetical protein